MTIAERIATIAAKSGVLAAYQKGEVASAGGGNLHTVSVQWYTASGDGAAMSGATLIVSGYGTPQEAAYWVGGLPPILAPAPAATRYITGRAVPFTRAQVVDFANAQWRASHANAPDILGVEIDNLDSKSIKFSGLFWTGAGARSARAYVIRLIDVNGDPSGSNVQLEQIT